MTVPPAFRVSRRPRQRAATRILALVLDGVRDPATTALVVRATGRLDATGGAPDRDAAVTRSGAPRTRALATAGADPWGALRDMVGEWRQSTAGAPLVVHVALLGELVELRTVTLPPVDDDDARRLLERAAARHFRTVGGAAVVVGVGPATAVAGAPFVTRVVAAAPRALRAQIADAIRDGGATAGVMLPALGVLGGAGATQVVSVRDGAVCTVLGCDDDGPRSLRRLPAGDREAIAEAISEAIDAAVGASAARPVATSPDARTRVPVVHVPPIAADDASDATEPPDALAADVARRLADWPADGADDAPLALRGDDATAPARRRSRRPYDGWRRRALLAAALLLLAAGAVHRAGLQHRLATVRAERAALAPQLEALGLRGDDPRAAWRAVREAETRSVRWSAVLGRLTAALPDDAHLVALRGDTTHVQVEGLAADAGTVFEALERAGFDELATVGPVRRERALDGTTADRFVLRARTPRPAPAAPVAARRTAADAAPTEVPR